MKLFARYLTVFLSLCSFKALGQIDSASAGVAEIPLKYITGVSAKTEKYSNRISRKTEKTLTKLTKWECRIHGILQKADPAADAKLFGPGKQTFSAMLQKIKEGKALQDKYKAQYDGYRDKLTINIKYLSAKKDSLSAKYAAPLKSAATALQSADSTVAQSETAEKLIRERKTALLKEAMKTLGKSRYLARINKESYYYTETLKNYKELFHDPSKTEAAAKEVLNKIPAFSKFMKQNSALASLFSSGSGGGTANITGLQTRAEVNTLIQNRIAQGGPNAAAQVSQNLQAAQAQLQQLKDKVLKAGGSNSSAEMPDFKPNRQKTKTFRQRLELSSNLQFGKPTRYTKSQADIGFGIGYKLNDKNTAGVGIAYKLGYGSIQKFRLSSEGLGVRSFLDYKWKKQFFISGGYEMNYNTVFTNLRSLQQKDAWQGSGLIGISKKIKMKTKFVKGTKLQLLYDFLYKTHTVSTQPIVFRVGYDF